jgi:hypothetical protein
MPDSFIVSRLSCSPLLSKAESCSLRRELFRKERPSQCERDLSGREDRTNCRNQASLTMSARVKHF